MDKLLELVRDPKIADIATSERLLANSKISNVGMLERLIGSSKIRDAKMLEDLLASSKMPHGAVLERLLNNSKLADGEALLRLLSSSKVNSAVQIERLLNSTKIVDSVMVERLLAHANIQDAKMLEDLLRHPGLPDGATLEHLLDNPDLAQLPGSRGPVAAHEPPGHLPSKHIGQTDTQLAARLAAEPSIPAASTFTSAADADAGVAAALRQNGPQLWKWLASGPSGALELTGTFSGGSVLLRGAAATTPGTGVTIIFRSLSGGGWFILTGFPIP